MIDLPDDSALVGTRVMITGGGGFLGSQLTRRLLNAGVEVLVVDRTIGKTRDFSDRPGYSFANVDLGEIEATIDCFRSYSPKAVFHFASAPDAAETYSQVRRSIDDSLLLTVNALEAFRLAAGELFVFGDSSKVYGNAAVPFRAGLHEQPQSSYAIAKSAGWNYCRNQNRVHGTRVVSVRPTLIYGPGQAFNLISYVVGCVMRGQTTIRLMGGSQTRDPLFCDDAVEAYVAVLRRQDHLVDQVVNIGGGRETTVLEIVQLILDVMSFRAEIISDEADRRPTEQTRSYCDNSEARELLRWQPRVGLEAGLRKTIQAIVAEFETTRDEALVH